MSLEGGAARAVPLVVTALPGVQSEERIAWLRQLEELHRQREKLETNVQHARNLETTRFQELDHSRNRFQSAQDRFNEALFLLRNRLEQFTSQESLRQLQETMPLQGDVVEDDALPGRVVEQCAAALDHHRQVIDTLESELLRATNQVQATLNDFHVP